LATAVKIRKKPARNLELPFADLAEGRIERGLSALLERPVTVVFTDNASTMISYSEKSGRRIDLRLHRMFREAREDIVEVLAEFIEKGNGKGSDKLNKFIKANHSLVRESRSRRKVDINPRGNCHDLEEIYRRLNDTYFDGKLDVAITWGRRKGKKPRWHIHLGSYSFGDRIIRIHPALDKSWVPKYYVECVVYHEMLHAHLLVSKKNGRRRYHTKEFYRMEKTHPHYERSKQWEDANYRRLLNCRVL